MHLKIFVFIYLFCVAYIQAQQPDSLSQQEIRKELETIKQFRQKDSIRIAMLLNEIQLLINNEKNTPSITNSSTTNEKEIEKLLNPPELKKEDKTTEKKDSMQDDKKSKEKK